MCVFISSLIVPSCFVSVSYRELGHSRKPTKTKRGKCEDTPLHNAIEGYGEYVACPALGSGFDCEFDANTSNYGELRPVRGKL